jgi:hypothetical protein
MARLKRKLVFTFWVAAPAWMGGRAGICHPQGSYRLVYEFVIPGYQVELVNFIVL